MTTLAESLTLLTSSLDALSEALASGQPDAVLSAEAPLAAALARVAAAMQESSPVDRARVRALVRDARIALLRCRALGQSAEQLARVLLAEPAYGPGALRQASSQHAFESRA